MTSQSGFPQDLLPKCWSDDTRMGVLFSPFRELSVNPENYRSKLKFWKEMISKYCEWKGTAEVTVQDIEEIFRRHEKKPYCIQKVFEEMLASGELKSRESFMEPPQTTWSGWATNLLVKKPLKWGVQTVKSRIFPPNFAEIAFVVQEVVENQATKLLKVLQNRLISQSEAMRLAEESLSLSHEGFVLTIQALLCQQKVATHCAPIEGSEEVLLKFAIPGEKIQAISEIEYSIYRLEIMEQELMKKIDALEEAAKREEEKAREFIKKANRNLAKLCLSRRNGFLKNLEKHTKTIMNIQEMLSKIRDVTLNKKILQTYKLGEKSLQDALEKSGITAEMVDQTVDEMREAIQLSDEVEAALGTDLSSPADNAELEQELANLLEEDAAQKIQDDDILKKLEALQIPEGFPSPHTPKQTETSQY